MRLYNGQVYGCCLHLADIGYCNYRLHFRFPVYAPCVCSNSAVWVRGVPEAQLNNVVGVALMVGLLKCCYAEHRELTPHSKTFFINQLHAPVIDCCLRRPYPPAPFLFVNFETLRFGGPPYLQPDRVTVWIWIFY